MKSPLRIILKWWNYWPVKNTTILSVCVDARSCVSRCVTLCDFRVCAITEVRASKAANSRFGAQGRVDMVHSSVMEN